MPTNTGTSYLEAQTHPEEVGGKGFALEERKSPLLLGAHADFERQAKAYRDNKSQRVVSTGALMAG